MQQAPRTVEPLLMSSLVLYVVDFGTRADTDFSRIQMLGELLPSTSVAPSRRFMTERAEFIVDVTKCIAHAEKTCSQDFIRDVATGLLRTSKHNSISATTAILLKRLAVDSAMAWVDFRGDNDSYVFAEDIRLRLGATWLRVAQCMCQRPHSDLMDIVGKQDYASG